MAERAKPLDVSREALERRLAEAEAQLAEARETLDAIRAGEVDALVVQGGAGPSVYTLESADRPYRVFVEQMRDGAVTFGRDGTVLYCNRRFAEILKERQERVVGASLQYYVMDEDRQTFEWLVSATGRGEFMLRAIDGSGVPVHLAVSELPGEGMKVYCAVVADLTEREKRLRELADANARITAEVAERQRTEAQLHQAQKMEAVGQLTGGIAHDFNNMLTAIMGNLELLMRRVEGKQFDVTKQAQGAMKAAMQAAGLTQRLLAFSRRQNLHPTAVCVNDLLPDMEQLIRRTIDVGIDIDTQQGTGLWLCSIDANQLQAAILNLAINSRDAMPNGGRLAIATKNLRLDERAAAKLPEALPGEYVEISVSDTGVGMSKAVASRVFEPFFTTKEVGRGSGLGLSQVYGFMRQSGGFVLLETEEGCGTSVRLLLPRTEAQPAVRPDAAAWASTRDLGKLRVLVVDDNSDVRSLTVQSLIELGYDVRSAANGVNALTMLDEGPEPNLLLTDIVMPGGVSGFDLARQARLKFPGIAILLTSGFMPNDSVTELQGSGGFGILHKPYRLADLSAAIETALQ